MKPSDEQLFTRRPTHNRAGDNKPLYLVHAFRGRLAKEHSMDSQSRFYTLEVTCRERARLADKESNYWLAESEVAHL